MPDWVNDLADVLEIAAFVTGALSWLLSRAVRTVLGHWLVRPDIPVEQEITCVVLLSLALFFGAAIFVWSESGAGNGLIRLAQYPLLFAIGFGACMLVWVTARLFAKISNHE